MCLAIAGTVTVSAVPPAVSLVAAHLPRKGVARGDACVDTTGVDTNGVTVENRDRSPGRSDGRDVGALGLTAGPRLVASFEPS
jgi:hypothetical protein